MIFADPQEREDVAQHARGACCGPGEPAMKMSEAQIKLLHELPLPKHCRGPELATAKSLVRKGLARCVEIGSMGKNYFVMTTLGHQWLVFVARERSEHELQ